MSFVDRIQRWIAEPPPDHLFEITEISLTEGSPRNPTQIRQHMFVERPLAPSPSAPNMIKAQLYRDALAEKFSKGASKRAAAGLVIPDYAVRMALLDFEAFPSSEEERLSLIRFRLRKSVPFHIDEAQVSYTVQSGIMQPNRGKRIEVLAVAIARPILQEYEALFTEAGYRVGLVMPSSIAMLPLCSSHASGLTLLAKSAGSTVSLLLLEGGKVRLVRCLDLTGGAPEGDEQAESGILGLLQQTAAYAEDQLGKPIERLLLCGFGGEMETIGRAAQAELGVAYQPVRSRLGTVPFENAGLLGLLEQYAA